MKWLDNPSLPNRLSVSRILMVPLVIGLLALDNRWTDLAACACFLLASLTDAADGYLARRYNRVSQLGKLLDPLADKLLVVSVLVMMIPLQRVHYLIAMVLIAREFAVTTLRGIATEEGVVIAASPLAKYKTLSQIAALTCLVLGPANVFFGIDWFALGELLLVVATALSLISGAQYFRAYRVGHMRGSRDHG